MNCQIFSCVHLFELQMILSYCDIMNRSELLMTHLVGCTNRHPSCWKNYIVQCPIWRDAPIGIRHVGRIILSNVPRGGMHQSASVMMVYGIEEMSHLAGCTNRHSS